jgi:hypothetical protein
MVSLFIAHSPLSVAAAVAALTAQALAQIEVAMAAAMARVVGEVVMRPLVFQAMVVTEHLVF